ncbi:MAG: hypothetical protein HY660_02185 [Armatimonadetes bacterium]|nr:hypothetical protein [Armatimonadota bacterium]
MADARSRRREGDRRTPGAGRRRAPGGPAAAPGRVTGAPRRAPARAAAEGPRLDGRVIVVGVCGGIAAYKVAQVVSTLRRRGAEVHVLMTAAATRFVGPVTFKALSQHPVITDMWDPDSPWDEPHVALGERAHLLLIAPATADMIGRLAAGLAGDVVSATAVATRAPVLLAPSMSDVMYAAPVVQENLQRLRARGYRVVGPEYGRLATGKEGWGRMSEPATILDAIVSLLPARPLSDRGGAR